MTAGISPKDPNKYVGPNVYYPSIVKRNRVPTGADFRQPETGKLYPVGSYWILGPSPVSGVEGDLWYLSKIVANIAYWVQMSSSPFGPLLQVTVPLGETPIVPDGLGNINFTSNLGTISITGSSASPNNHTINFDMVGGGIGVDSFLVQSVTAPGVNPVTADGGGQVTINGAVVANHSVVLESRSRALNTLNLEIQYATSAAATDGTKSGVCHFDSTDFSVDASGFVTLNGAGAGQTITGQSGGALPPSGGNWNIYGLGETVTSGSGSTLSIFSPRAYENIVDPTADYGTFQTIAAAIAGTASGDVIFIRPGTYTENITLTSGRKFIGSNTDESSTIILGKVSDGGNVLSATFQNLTLKTNGDYALAMSASGSVFTLNNCHIRANNFTAIQVNNTGATLVIDNCTGNIDTTGIAFWTSSGAIQVYDSAFDNTGASTTASSNSGNTLFRNSKIVSPMSCSSTGTLAIRNSDIDTSLQNTIAITIAGSGTSEIYNTTIKSGSAANVTIGTGASCQIANSECNSSTTNVLTGLGTLLYGSIVFTGSSNGHNVSTETALTVF